MLKRMLRQMFTPRDLRPRATPLRLTMETLEERLTPYNTTDPWGTSTISYSYSNFLDGTLQRSDPGAAAFLSTNELTTLAEEAMGVWSSVAAVAFYQRGDSGPAASDQSYERRNHPTIRWGHHSIDGTPSTNDTLAHAYPPGGNGINGDMHFDRDNSFALNPAPAGASLNVQALEVAVHEIGHALGMKHSNGDASTNPGRDFAIMHAYIHGSSDPNTPTWNYSGLGTSFLLADDIAGIQSLYGVGLGYVLDLNGRMHVYGGQGDDNIIIIGQSDDGSEIVVTIGSATMHRTMQGVNEVWVHGRGGNDFFQVNNTGRLGVTVLGDAGNDSFSVDGIRGANVTVNAGVGTDSAVVSIDGKNATLNSMSMTVGNRTINYSPDGALERLQVTGNSSSKLTTTQASAALYRVFRVNTVNLQAVGSTLEVVEPRVVTLGGAAGMNQITAPVNLNSPSYIDLTVDDVAGNTVREVHLRLDSITGFPGTISWNSAVVFPKFQISGGNQGNRFIVVSTPNTPVTLNTGTGADRVIVESTSAAINVNGQDGNDTVFVSQFGSARAITGQVTISNARGYTGVVVNDSEDTAPRTVLLYKDKKNYNLSGLTPSGDIVMVGTDINSLQVTAGSGGNTFRVHDTPGDAPGMSTTLNLGTGSDTVRINATTGDLVLNTESGQNTVIVGSESTGMNRIQGTVTVNGQGIVDSLEIDDRASKTADIHTHTVQADRYTRTGTAPVFMSNLWSFSLREGSAQDTTNVQANPTVPLYFGFSVYTGAGSDVVNLGNSTNQLIGLSRMLVDGQGGNDVINLRDQGRTVADNYRFGFEFGSATSPYVSSEQLFLSHANTEKLTIQGGSGGNTIRVEDLAASLSLNPGLGDDQVTIGNTSNRVANIASVEVFDTGGDDQLTVLDQGTTTNRHYEVTGGANGRGAVKARASRFLGAIRFDQNIFFEKMETVTVNAGSGNDYLNIRSTPIGIFHGLKVNAGVGDDTVVLGTGNAVDANGRPIYSSLNGLFSPVQIEGQQGSDTIRFDDVDTIEGQLFDISPGFVERSAMADVRYTTVESVALLAGLGNDTFKVIPGVGVAQSLDGGQGNNTLDYSGSGSNSDTLPGTISRYLADGTFDDVLGNNPGTPANGVTFDTGFNGQAFSFDGIDDYVDLGYGPSLDLPGNMTVAAWVNIESLSSYKYLVADFDIGGGYSQGSLGIVEGQLYWHQSNDDGTSADASGTTVLPFGQWLHLAVVRDDAIKTVELFVNGVSEGVHPYTGSALPLQGSKLIGTSLPTGFPSDFFHGRMDDVSLIGRALTPAEVALLTNGGQVSGGTTVDVEVNLRLGTATGFTNGINNIRNVIGGSGNDILVGNGSNVLSGGAGRDLLIAGALASTLLGGGDEDLLIGGTTNYDTNVVALRAIRTEWTKATTYSERVANLTTNNGVSVPKLTSATVRSNGGSNTVLGGADTDLFFCLLNGDLHDRTSGESLICL